MQRPQPVHCGMPKFSWKYWNLWLTRWRSRAPCVSRGLWPEVCMVKSVNWQLSQVRTRLPFSGVALVFSSLMSKQWQVGHRKVQKSSSIECASAQKLYRPIPMLQKNHLTNACQTRRSGNVP
jgi:hypothetical protein